ncbi:MAG: hypothetical protein IKL29_03535 [Bacteroidaceae bacterium]|nr:hypothetical protein [Bacteroidaceae bacterium]
MSDDWLFTIDTSLRYQMPHCNNMYRNAVAISTIQVYRIANYPRRKHQVTKQASG